MVERPSYRLAFLLPDEISAYCDFIFGCFRTSVGHMLLVASVTSAKKANYSMVLPRPGVVAMAIRPTRRMQLSIL